MIKVKTWVLTEGTDNDRVIAESLEVVTTPDSDSVNNASRVHVYCHCDNEQEDGGGMLGVGERAGRPYNRTANS